MKSLKIDQLVHESVKKFCKENGLFIQDWTEYTLLQAIKNNYCNMFKDKLNELSKLMTICDDAPLKYDIMLMEYRIDDTQDEAIIQPKVWKKKGKLVEEKFTDENDFFEKISQRFLNKLEELTQKRFELGGLFTEDNPMFRVVIDDTEAGRKKCFTKIKNSSGLIATEGRMGPAQWVIAPPAFVKYIFSDSNFSVASDKQSHTTTSEYLIPNGMMAGITIYSDPRVDCIYIGRTNPKDSTGIALICNTAISGKVDHICYDLDSLGSVPERQFVKLKIDLSKTVENINSTPVINKWKPILAYVTSDESKHGWMAEYAERHTIIESKFNASLLNLSALKNNNTLLPLSLKLANLIKCKNIIVDSDTEEQPILTFDQIDNTVSSKSKYKDVVEFLKLQKSDIGETLDILDIAEKKIINMLADSINLDIKNAIDIYGEDDVEFIPNVLVRSISLISESKFEPKMMIRTSYAIRVKGDIIDSTVSGQIV